MYFSQKIHSYSYALYNYAKQNNNIEQVVASAKILKEIIAQNENLTLFLSNPSIAKESRRQFIKNILTKAQCQVLEPFIAILINNGVFQLIQQIISYFFITNAVESGAAECYAITTYYLTEEELALASRVIKQYCKKEAYVHNSILRSIIGGMIVHISEKAIDLSYTKQINVAIAAITENLGDKDLLDEMYN